MHIDDSHHRYAQAGALGTWSNPYPGSTHPDDDWPYVTDPVSAFAAPYEAGTVRLTDRLTHMVLIDGRLVEFWTEPVEGTRWAHHADALDRHTERVAAGIGRIDRSVTLAPYEAMLAWLEALLGGPAGLDSVTATPLAAAAEDEAAPQISRAADQQRVDQALEHLDCVAETWFDPEVRIAFRRALVRVLDAAPDLVLDAKSAGLAAGGVCWAVLRANDLIGADRPVRVTDVQRLLGTSSLGQRGGQVARALYGLRPAAPARPQDCPDLVPLGQADLLTSTTRSRLLRWRDRAQETRALYAPTVQAAYRD